MPCIPLSPWKDVMVLAASAHWHLHVKSTLCSVTSGSKGIQGWETPQVLSRLRGKVMPRAIWVTHGSFYYSSASGWPARQQGFGGHQSREMRRGWIFTSSAPPWYLQGKGGQEFTSWAPRRKSTWTTADVSEAHSRAGRRPRGHWVILTAFT